MACSHYLNFSLWTSLFVPVPLKMDHTLPTGSDHHRSGASAPPFWVLKLSSCRSKSGQYFWQGAGSYQPCPNQNHPVCPLVSFHHPHIMPLCRGWFEDQRTRLYLCPHSMPSGQIWTLKLSLDLDSIIQHCSQLRVSSLQFLRMAVCSASMSLKSATTSRDFPLS